MIRILGGEKKGSVLRAPRGRSVRPTTANVRQVLFDILGPAVSGSLWLDLYAGSGAVGLEALSRGAAACVFVESSRRSLDALRQNVKRLDYGGRCLVVAEGARRALRRLSSEGRRFDIVFLDPPYRGDEATGCLLTLGGTPAAQLLRSADSIVVAQLSVHADVRSTYGMLALTRERRIGDSRLCFFRLHDPPGGRSGPSA